MRSAQFYKYGSDLVRSYVRVWLFTAIYIAWQEWQIWAITTLEIYLQLALAPHLQSQDGLQVPTLASADAKVPAHIEHTTIAPQDANLFVGGLSINAYHLTTHKLHENNLFTGRVEIIKMDKKNRCRAVLRKKSGWITGYTH